ncbi:MAG: HAMP domain-containing histidine kinase, partial [Clostridia bacterium]|nr:HAMP domain-containing histidine kinase [Clostridia bacterium]
SHDLKTPLSEIKLYSQALARGLYPDKDKQIEIANRINEKTDEIESYVSQIITASREDFLNFDVSVGEFYLKELVDKIVSHYSEKMALVRTDFALGEYGNCLLKGDLDRSVEVIQNLMENAIKYGDGRHISMDFGVEEDCVLIGVTNSGCTLPEGEINHIFESFFRGSNADKQKGSGLGLYIARQLMLKMDGETFARITGDEITVTAVFRKA